jgi:hypothetical protein
MAQPDEMFPQVIAGVEVSLPGSVQSTISGVH